MGMRENWLQGIEEDLRGASLERCSRWAEFGERRIMGPPFAGPYSFVHHPWCRAIHDSQAIYTIAMKGAQLGITEVAINRTFFTLDQLHRDVLYVLPTQKNAGDFSKARFAIALNLSPYLKALFVDTNSVNLKSTGLNTLYIRGSRGDSNMKSIPVSELVLDEMDEMDKKAVELALERLSGQIEKHIVAVSTPTVPKKGVHALYLTSTQEHYYFRCPHCSRLTELVWPDCIEIIGEAVTDRRCHESFLKCKECQKPLDHATKRIWLAENLSLREQKGVGGLWLPHTEVENGIWTASPPGALIEERRGFNINQLYSPTITPGEIVVGYFNAQQDPIAAQQFDNNKLGKPHIGEGAQITDDMLEKATGNFTSNEIRPERGGTQLITLGADQGKIGYISIVDWEFDTNNLDDIQNAAIGKLIWYGKFRGEDWSTLYELMYEYQVLAAVVDADPEINEARKFCREFPGYAWATRYRSGQVAKEISIQEADTGAPIAHVDRTSWLSSTLGRFKINPPRLLLPADISLEYKEHLKNLVRRYETDAHGNYESVYVEIGPEHYAHSLCYACIGLSLLDLGGGCTNITKRKI